MEMNQLLLWVVIVLRLNEIHVYHTNGYKIRYDIVGFSKKVGGRVCFI